MSAAFNADALARCFVEARAHRATLDTLPDDARPSNADEAYAAQAATLRLLDARTAGWKVGAKSPAADAPIQGAPLAADGVHRSGVRLSRQAFGRAGLELEVAFVFDRTFEAHSGPYSDDEVIAAIDTLHASIEVVASRFSAWPEVDKLWQLADLQNHGALVVGEGVRCDDAFPFVSPSMTFTLDDAPLFDGKPANPAGDPRRLLAWTINHSVSRGIAFERGTIITAGSYTGLAIPGKSGVVRGTIAGLPPVELHFA
jgi:2-keto-4-pentenoate hydratase